MAGINMPKMGGQPGFLGGLIKSFGFGKSNDKGIGTGGSTSATDGYGVGSQVTAGGPNHDGDGGGSGGAGALLSLLAARGGVVPGKAPVPGDSTKNDIVEIGVSPGEGIIPRSKMADLSDPMKRRLGLTESAGQKFAQGGEVKRPKDDVPEPDPRSAKQMQDGATSGSTSASDAWKNLKSGLGFAHGGTVPSAMARKAESKTPSEHVDHAIGLLSHPDVPGHIVLLAAPFLHGAKIFGGPHPAIDAHLAKAGAVHGKH